VDVAIEACKSVGVNLKIVGEGPDAGRLKNLAVKKSGNSTIEFLGYVSDEEKIQAIQNCTALIVTQKEDFGITALEAMALGKPVIAYRAGGALETVIEGKTGVFFNAQTPQSLAQILLTFTPSSYTPQDCVNQSRNFSKQKFLTQLDDLVKTLYNSKTNLP
jgi:glycosyltransferase involved in cell wall biosynthesis